MVLRNLPKAALFLAFLLALFLSKEAVMVAMSFAPVEMYLPVSWLPHAPYLILAGLVFPIVAWLFVKVFQQRAVALSMACSVLFLAVYLISLYQSEAGSDSYVIVANTVLAISYFLWAVLFYRLAGRGQPIDS